MFTEGVRVPRSRQLLIRFIRIYPVIALVVLGSAYGVGGFGPKADALIPQHVIITGLFVFVGVVPLAVILGFLLIGRLSNSQSKLNLRHRNRLDYKDAFALPVERMSGFKLATLTGRAPILTGLTGDTYSADAAAVCTANPDHVPPVVDCECGFYAFKDLRDAKFELSINPGAFLLAVELYGIGFIYDGGYRGEVQVVSHLAAPKRCMRCKILPPKVFVTSFKMGYGHETWWQWQIRCRVCSSTFKEADKMSIEQMSKALGVVIS